MFEILINDIIVFMKNGLLMMSDENLLDVALDFFYHSEVYLLMRDGVSDMHCMSDDYLAEELQQEYVEKCI